ncbi:hypothetical protein ONA70_29525 [Micromonospora yasonensis]|uniref:hypothetical protein n=1 Tax=Micromonospora yasonensis TaxID=1128667 RepID=UPI002231B330|nr:hypothetical protein [Micromonospora yasonensis]MCW3844237.1 hypothetical protein [Micromonospora yasonensis]
MATGVVLATCVALLCAPALIDRAPADPRRDGVARTLRTLAIGLTIVVCAHVVAVPTRWHEGGGLPRLRLDPHLAVRRARRTAGSPGSRAAVAPVPASEPPAATRVRRAVNFGIGLGGYVISATVLGLVIGGIFAYRTAAFRHHVGVL